MKQSIKPFIIMQALNILFSLSGVVVKFASLSMTRYGLLSLKTAGTISVYVILMMIYAFFWQKVIKMVSLSSAYLSKGLLLFWSLMWAVLIFSEKITLFNIVGAIIICCGTLLVSANE